MTNAVLQFALPTVAQVRVGVLVVLLLAAAVIDWRTFRIPNWLTLGGAVAGLALNAAAAWQSLSIHWAFDGFLWALGGMAAGLVMMLPLYLLHVMGAGDVKLMAMVGAFIGLSQIVQAVLCVFIVGGIVAIGVAVWRRAFRRFAANVTDAVSAMAFAVMAGVRPDARAQASIGTLPYGISICAGTIAWVAAGYLGYV